MYTEQRRMIILYELAENNRYEEQARWVRGTDVPAEFTDILPADDWEEMSDDRIINMIDGPYVVAAYVDEESGQGVSRDAVPVTDTGREAQHAKSQRCDTGRPHTVRPVECR
jgi:hypothetical protein